MDWRSCKAQRFVKEVNKDKNFILSLVRGSLKKLKAQELLKLNEDTATAKVSLAYDSLRELLEATAIARGYKIYNHECYVPFLGEILMDSTSAERFNRLRKIRNDINYYGKDISLPEAESILKEIKELIEKIRTQVE